MVSTEPAIDPTWSWKVAKYAPGLKSDPKNAASWALERRGADPPE